MNLKEYVFILENYNCNKNCPYCIAKMNKNHVSSFENEIKNLQEKIKEYQEKNIKFDYFILSGNGEPSLYTKNELQKIKDIVEKSKIFKDYRIQTSGNLFQEKEKLTIFSKWIKEITVVSSYAEEDQSFYKYQTNYINSKTFLKSKRIRVNIVLLKNNINKINKYINFYTNLNCVETIALKILDNSHNETKESMWINQNAISHKEIDKIIDMIKKDNKFITFSNKRFIFNTINNKRLTIHYSNNNTYDEINLKNKFNWHNRLIKKGVYGEFSKVIEEVEEAKEALEQNNRLMYLIELSDIIGAIEKIAENHSLTLEDLINFSNKVKESKKYENV